ncbi:MAG: hypothetical protein NC344_02430 [Bacteroidales bacterium]|nr:hypothetical protein [Bacteroidales bacterium]MCM1146688.1 hypothetical protein [Bacteroidales bacterium]MCM1205505.1 hypothetical protein [Bacillota bacterium]MCM1509234.1 hypothetical protein [Clostridium sp.]
MFMTLYHTGKTDREVCNIMGIEPASIRSIKTRIKQPRFEGNKENE